MKLIIKSLVEHKKVTLEDKKNELTIDKLTVRGLDRPKKFIWNIDWLGDSHQMTLLSFRPYFFARKHNVVTP